MNKTTTVKRKIIKLIIIMVLFALIFLMGIPVFAADLPSAIPEKQQLEQTINAYVEKHKDTTAAMSIAVFTKDSVLLEKFYGYANIEDNVPNNADTVIEWGSITKLLTWISVMQLAEEGKIDLNEDIRTYLPKSFLKKLKYDDPITMFHLMNHTAGWQEVQIGMVVPEGGEIKELGDALKALEPVQVFRPGEYTAYSNYGVALAGYIVEQLAGKPFYEYVHENIFTPLEMKHTALKPDFSDNPWVKERCRQLVRYTTDLQNLGTQPFCTPLYTCGQATGTIADLRKFAMALLPDGNGGSQWFKKAETLTKMFAPTSYYSDGKTAIFCHGFEALAGCQGNVIGHSGNTPSCSSMLAIDPDTGVGTVIMTNQQNEGIYNYRLLYEIFGTKDLSGSYNLTDEDISGVYIPSRNIFKGILKISGIFNIVPVISNDDGTLNNPMGGLTFEYVAPGVYKGSMGDMIVPAYAKFNQAGQVEKLSGAFMDLIPTSLGLIIFDIITLLFFVITGLYGLLILIVMLARKLLKKQQPMGGLRAAVCVTTLASLMNFIFLLFLAAVTVQGILFMLFALIPVVYTIMMALEMKKLELFKQQKRQLIMTSVMGLITTFNILYWQLWMFWV
jgi:CubicO group peptidase (beta-lactamase class C family)